MITINPLVTDTDSAGAAMAKQSAGRRMGVADFKEYIGKKTKDESLIKNAQRARSRVSREIREGRVPWTEEEQIEWADYIRFEDVFRVFEQHLVAHQLNASRMIQGITNDIRQVIDAERNYARSLSHPMIYKRGEGGALEPRAGRTLREAVEREITEYAEVGAPAPEVVIDELTSIVEEPVDRSDKGEPVEEPPKLLDLFTVMDRAESMDDAIDVTIVPALIQNADTARYMAYGAAVEDTDADPIAWETGLPQYMELTHDEYQRMAEPTAKRWSGYLEDRYREIRHTLRVSSKYMFLARVIARFMGVPDAVDAMASPGNDGHVRAVIIEHNAAIEELKKALMIRRTLPDARSRTLNVGEADDAAAETPAGPVDDREYVSYARTMLLEQLQTITIPEEVPEAVVNRAARRLKHEDLPSSETMSVFISSEYPRTR